MTKKAFHISYNFDGCGTAVVVAESEEEAVEKFYSGEDVSYGDEGGDVYEISEIFEVGGDNCF